MQKKRNRQRMPQPVVRQSVEESTVLCIEDYWSAYSNLGIAQNCWATNSGYNTRGSCDFELFWGHSLEVVIPQSWPFGDGRPVPFWDSADSYEKTPETMDVGDETYETKWNHWDHQLCGYLWWDYMGRLTSWIHRMWGRTETWTSGHVCGGCMAFGRGHPESCHRDPEGGVPLGYPYFAGWFLREIPTKNGWFGGTPIFETHHIYPVVYAFFRI